MRALTRVLLSLFLTGILAPLAAGCASDQSPQPPTTSSKQAVETVDGGTAAPSTGTGGGTPSGGW
jgi:hypothetical protein